MITPRYFKTAIPKPFAFLPNWRAARGTRNSPSNLATRERKRDALSKLIAAHTLALKDTLVTNSEADSPDFRGGGLLNGRMNMRCSTGVCSRPKPGNRSLPFNVRSQRCTIRAAKRLCHFLKGSHKSFAPML